jgi:chloride channel protein, CIC family
VSQDSKIGGPAKIQIGDAAGYRVGFISILAAGVGLLAGVVAFVLYEGIALVTNLAFYHQVSFHFRSPAENHLGLWVIGVPVVGGLIVGFMAKYGSRKIKGHGIPEAMEAVLTSRSRIDPKVAILKPVSAAIAIGTGGPFGAEGPIIQTGGALGSLTGQLFATTAAERKVLLAAGAAAGMAATFNTPIAAVILAIELLLFEFRSRSFIPLVIATTLATFVRFMLLGNTVMFHFSGVDFGVPRNLPFYLILGVLCGFAAIGLTRFLYWVEDLFDRLPFDDFWHPAVGALAAGVIGYFIPRVLGVGYDSLSDILNGQLAFKLLLLLAVFKMLALVITLGSGTSGGLLAPTFISSAAMGGAFACVINYLFPSAHLAPAAFALVAMGAVFGAAARSTFAFIVFAFEITHDYNSILPLMLVCVIADAIAIRYLPNSIMTEKLARRGLHTHQDYEANVMRHVKIQEVMFRDVATVPPAMMVGEVVDGIASRDPRFARHHAILIVDDRGLLDGLVTQSDLLRMMELEGGREKTVLEAGTRSLVVCYPDETVFAALTRMLRSNIGRLPVVSREDPHRMIGYVSRASILSAWGRHMDDESVRERGWFGDFLAGQDESST